MKIDYPSPEERRATIRKITREGMADRRSLFSDFREMYRNLGLRVIFYDMADVFFIAALVTAFVLCGLAENFRYLAGQRNNFYAKLFAVSPTLYLLLCLLGFWKEKLSDTYDVKMSCKYTVCHLTAFRMLAFSCAGILVNLAAVGIFCTAGGVPDFWQVFLVSTSSLFLFSVLLLWSLFRAGGLAAPTFAAAAWFPANLLLEYLFPSGYGRFLVEMPLYLHLAVTVALACFYFAGLKRLISQQKERILC